MEKKVIPRRLPRISVAIPASFLSGTNHLRDKTIKVSLVGRALAIFRVDEVLIYLDKPKSNQERDVELIKSVLSYMETPQYLRKFLFGLMPQLKYVGIVPPLRTPHHPLKNKIEEIQPLEYREGVVVSVTDEGMYVDVGVEKPIFVRSMRTPVNSRVTLKIAKKNGCLKAELVSSDAVNGYWGYKVVATNLSLGGILEEVLFDLVIATSKYGVSIMEVYNKFMNDWCNSKRVLLVFGSYDRGLHEIASREGLDLKDIADYIINTVPNQGTSTVRIEEALYSTLAVLNIIGL